jgi:serine-type D-Ala-D-Ala carboxypeptidase (penicillin-binding protein 5/6)
MQPLHILKNVGLFTAFVLLAATTFFGVQWFSTSVSGFFYQKSVAGLSEGINNVQASTDTNLQPVVISPPAQEDQTINADSFIVMQVNSGNPTILLSKDENKQLPIASLTKLMTALLVLETYHLSDHITISHTAMTVQGEQGDLKEGQVLSVNNLLYIMLIESSNRAAYALSEVMGPQEFINAMNVKAQELGLTHTHFADNSGLSEESYSTTKDLAMLSEYVYNRYPLFGQIIGLKEYNLYLDDGTFHHTLKNTNELLGDVAGVIGGKTGYTDAAQGCLMVLQQGKQPGDYVIDIILGAGDRFAEMKKLINLVDSSYNS